MPLAPGSRIGPYEVTALIGEGGMGKVWRAHHTALKRDDVLKVLPNVFASDPERLRRFQREAQVLASLNHPNIAHVYGLEQPDGVQALVMELVEGPTLADHIAQGPIPVDEALPIAKQITEALEAAHEQGIIHRDLKPANIKVRHDGTVKVLDFGLAKALEPMSPAGVDATASPTITSPAMMTGVGVLLGTAAYMSPEQSRGKPVDKRTDIWAFGCVLYEMLTGKPAFEGEHVSDTMASILKIDPDLKRLPRDVPTAIRVLLRRCFEKDRRRRPSGISAALVLMEEHAALSGGPGTSRDMRRRMARAAVLMFVVGGAVAGAAMWFLSRPPAPPRIERFVISTAAPAAGPADRSVTITPDGTRIVYVGGNGKQLLVRASDQLETTTIATGNIRGPFVAPDGQWIGFVDQLAVLKRVAIGGGPAVTIMEMDDLSRGATWIENDAIVFGTASRATGLQQISAGGGEVMVLTTPDRERGEIDHVWPESLPGGRAVLFTIPHVGGLDAAEVAVLDLNTGTHKILLKGGSHAQYVPTGHVVYTVGATLRAIAFDLRRFETRGTALPVLPQLATTNQGAGNYAFATDGTLVYVDGSVVYNPSRALVWVDRQGLEQPVGAPPRAYDDISISPDGAQILAQINEEVGGGGGVWVYDITRGTLARSNFEDTVTMPSWSADGRDIVFAAQRDTSEGLFSMPVDGTGPPERLTVTNNPAGASTVSPDGGTLAFESRTGRTGDIWVLPLRGERRPKPWFETPFIEEAPRFSPEGRWLAYRSNESGRNEVYVQPFPGPGGKRLISNEGGIEPVWSRSGRELFYRSGDKMVAVDIQTTPTFNAGPPHVLFEKSGYFSASRQYDVAPDGRRFLMLKLHSDVPATPPQVVVVKNWFEELKRLVPTN